jgi:hypothetical protein
MDLVSISGKNVLSRAGKTSGKNVTEGTETHDEAMLLQHCFCTVSVFHRDDAP